MSMALKAYTARDFADAMLVLLPPGAAWDWPVGGVGDSLMLAMAQELARIASVPPAVLNDAVIAHQHGSASFHISVYRTVAAAAVAGTAEAPRKSLRVGSHVGDRCWSHAPASFTVPLVQVDHLIFKPLRVGSHVGDGCWGSGARLALRVRYYRGVVNLAALAAALRDFKQAHIYLWFEDITGCGGEDNHEEN